MGRTMRITTRQLRSLSFPLLQFFSFTIILPLYIVFFVVISTPPD